MRVVQSSRFIGDPYADDAQSVININPKVVQILRGPSNTLLTAAAPTIAASFEASIVPYRQSSSVSEQSSDAAVTTENKFLLVALFGHDRLGNIVDIRHRDYVLENNHRYYVVSTVSPDNQKIEAVLRQEE